MIGTLGRAIVFEVSDSRVMTFSGMSREISGRWATHEALGGKPKAEFLGAELQSVTLEITLCATLGVKPRAILEAVERMVESGAAEWLIIGGRPVGRHPFRLLSSSETWGTVYNRGELAKAQLSITLGEYT